MFSILQLLLDMSIYADEVTTRRCLKSHPLVDALHLTDFPTMAIYRRGERGPVLTAEFVFHPHNAQLIFSHWNRGRKSLLTFFAVKCNSP